jgi:DNA-binding transcriptional LysR family regulator
MHFDSPPLRRLKLSDLRMLHAVVEAGSMVKASRQLNVTQPAVSKAIAALEHTLGVRLLDRTSHGVEPTIYGRALLKSGLAVFDELHQSLQKIAFLSKSYVGELRIGCSEYAAASIISVAIDRFSRRFPRVSFNVATGDPTGLMNRELRQRNIEFLLAGSLDEISGPDLTIQPLYMDRQLIVAGTKNKWTRRRKIALADLMNEPWILPPLETWAGAAIAREFRARGLEPPPSRTTSYSLPLCHQLLATGRYLTSLPVVMARLAKDLPIKALDVDYEVGSRPVGIMTLKGRTPSPLAQLFIDAIRDIARPLPQAK